jgi:hypothetical protein
MKYARVNNNGIVQEVFIATTGVIDDYFHEDVAKQFVQVADDVQAKWIKNPDGTYSPPSVVAATLPRSWNSENFRNAMTLAEKVKWDSNSAPEIVTVKQELVSGANQTKTQELVDLLVSENLISQNTASKIMS